MHNLFLGMAKKIVDLWKECDFLPPSELQDIQVKVDSVISPTDLGCLPSQTASGFRIHSRTMEKLDTLLFPDFFERCTTTQAL